MLLSDILDDSKGLPVYKLFKVNYKNSRTESLIF